MRRRLAIWILTTVPLVGIGTLYAFGGLHALYVLLAAGAVLVVAWAVIWALSEVLE